jgi:hypothetical protein
VGASELALHCGIAACRGVLALANEKQNYACVLLKDGRVYDGVFRHFGDGRFSLS